MAKEERRRRGSNTDRPQQLHKQSQDCPWRAKNSAQRGCYKAVSDCLIARHIITMIVVALALLTAKATRLYMFDLAVVTAMLCASRACAATQSWRWLPPYPYRRIALRRPLHFSQLLSPRICASRSRAMDARLLYNIPQVTTLAYSPLPASVEQEGPTRHVRDMHAAGTCTC